MAYDHKHRQAVRRSYVSDRMNLRAACSLHDIPYDTARRWKALAREQGDDWDHARRATQIAGAGPGALTKVVLDEFVPLFESTIKALKLQLIDEPIKQAEAISRLADAYTKTIKAAGAVDPELARLSIALDTVKDLVGFVRVNYPQHQDIIVEILEPFGVHLSEQYG